MIDEKVLIERLEEEKQSSPCRNTQCKDCQYTNQCYEGEQCYKVGMDNVVAIVNQLAEEHNNGWIPCSDRLPRIGEQVMVCNRYGSVFVSHITYLNPRVDIRGCCHDFGSHYDVIAWQPLPAPYQPKGEQP